MIAQSAAEVDSALGAEAWASHLLGTFRAPRPGLPFPDAVEVDPALLFGKPLVTRLATFDDRPPRLRWRRSRSSTAASCASWRLSCSPARRRWPAFRGGSSRSASRRSSAPRWLSEVVFDDARTLMLESRHPDGETMAVGVLIDRNLGGPAKDVLLAESIEQVAGAMGRNSTGEEAEPKLERIDPGVAAGLIQAAIARTDMTWDPPVDEDFWTGRALALLRAGGRRGAPRGRRAVERGARQAARRVPRLARRAGSRPTATRPG
ncbi:MAG: hypothetical protein JO179_23285 [Solirubrobacterales bacterium]|nr:hypothetical protein [Solirubrobacterales bacterium]